MHRAAKFIENLQREKSDLTLVVVAVIEEAVAANPVAGDALDLMGFDKRKIIRRPAVMAKIVVIGRNEYLLDDHAGTLPYPGSTDNVESSDDFAREGQT